MEREEVDPLRGEDAETASRRPRLAALAATLSRACLVEFVGDLLFVFLGSMQALSGAGVVGAALCHGITIFVLIAGLGHISGGHFNPAVTIGAVIGGGIPLINAIFYIASQLLGGLVGAMFVRAVSHGNAYELVIKGGVTVPGTDVYAMEAITCEAIMTYLLVTTVLVTAVDTSSNVLAPLAIGLSIATDILGGAKISGASMNPARSFGPAVAYSIFGNSNAHWDMHYVYWIGPLLGAAVAGTIYRLFFGNEDKRILLK